MTFSHHGNKDANHETLLVFRGRGFTVRDWQRVGWGRGWQYDTPPPALLLYSAWLEHRLAFTFRTESKVPRSPVGRLLWWENDGCALQKLRGGFATTLWRPPTDTAGPGGARIQFSPLCAGSSCDFSFFLICLFHFFLICIKAEENIVLKEILRGDPLYWSLPELKR